MRFATPLIAATLALATLAAYAADREPIYKDGADGFADVDAAIARAKAGNKRVLIQYGANWCGWCYKLHDVFKNNKDIALLLNAEYELVLVNSDDNKAVAKKYKTDIRGVPFLTVLDSEGNKLTDQETGALEEGAYHDPEKVIAFLTKWKAEPQDAEAVYDAAIKEAKEARKLAFVHFGAPWCGWCHRLDALLQDDAFAPTFAKGFIDVKLDTDRMTDAEKVQDTLKENHGGGIPWWAVVDGEGTVLATSDNADDDNTGYPVRAPEIAVFMKAMSLPAAKLEADDIAQLEAVVKEKAASF